MRTVPFSFGLVSKSHTVEVKPFNFAIKVVTANHFAVGHLVAQTISGLVRIDGKVQGRSFTVFLHHLALLLLLGPRSFVFILLQT